MTKTLRVRTATGWVTKPAADTEANKLTAEEMDDNFLELEDYLADSGSIDPGTVKLRPASRAESASWTDLPDASPIPGAVYRAKT